MAYGLKNVRQDIRDRIAALDGSPYAQGAGTTTWRESKDVRGPMAGGDSGPYLHLSYAVQMDSAPNTYRNGDGAQGEARIRVQVLVEWVYQVRGQKWGDVDLAMDAAEAIASALLANPNADYHIDLANLWIPRLLPDGKFLYVQQRFDVVYTTSLAT